MPGIDYEKIELVRKKQKENDKSRMMHTKNLSM